MRLINQLGVVIYFIMFFNCNKHSYIHIFWRNLLIENCYLSSLDAFLIFFSLIINLHCAS